MLKGGWQGSDGYCIFVHMSEAFMLSLVLCTMTITTLAEACHAFFCTKVTQ